jgi:hypothetical protein
MLASALFAAAIVLALAALRFDDVRQRRRIAALEARCGALEARCETAEIQHERAWARIDRLQGMVTDRGWRDSMLLTKFDWRKPDPF